MAAQALYKKDEDGAYEEYHSMFSGIEKGAVLQEARVFFNEAQLDSRRCSQVITKLLYLLNQGETFTKVEATEVFFAVTKLFQSTDKGLRRMVYLMIKELLTCADEVFIVTSSLMKDMNSITREHICFRANAIRVLCRIADGTLVPQIERYLKQAIVDKNPVVSSAALVSAIHLFQTNPEIIKRWSNEVQQAVQYSGAALVQFHALALLHQIRQDDVLLAVTKLITSLTRVNTVNRSPMAECLLIRCASQVVCESAGSSRQLQSDNCRPLYDYLESCLQHKADMVILEAARAITELPSVNNQQMAEAIMALNRCLSSTRLMVLRFAAIRTLSKVAMTHPMFVATMCNNNMESLVSDLNRSIATLAITTLLKTTNEEATVVRLLKKITNFMSDIADVELKIFVVEAIRSFSVKHPRYYREVMEFLSYNLREEGGEFEYKKAIVDSIVILIRDVPAEAKESGLLHLCEFLDEDFNFTYLTTQILHLLGIEGPRTTNPSKYIRYINNRVHLDANASVRASAVSTLAKFGAKVNSLKPQVLILLKRCLFDNDDEVRDRAAQYVKILGEDHGSILVEDVNDFLFGSLDVPLANLEKCLRTYLASPSEEPFDISSVPEEIETQAHSREPATSTRVSVSSIPEFSNFGVVFKSSEPVELTEAETEYAVSVVKHIFDRHVVFEYICTNTIPENLLEKVVVAVDAYEGDDFTQAGYRPIKSLPYDTPRQAFAAFEKPREVLAAVGKFSNMMRFTVKEVDPTTGEVVEEDHGVEDEYQLDNIEVVPADYMLTGDVIHDFRQAWETMGPDFELVEEYGLGQRESLSEVVATAINLLGMQPCEGTEVVAGNSRSHMVLLSGVYIGNVDVLVRLSFGHNSSSKEVVMKVAVRSNDGSVSCAIHDMVDSA